MRSAATDSSGSSTTEALGELVLLARQGDDRAWRALIEQCMTIVRAVARGYRLQDSDADDVVQIVCLALFEHLERIREPRALPAWVITTARRESLRLLRRREKVVPVAFISERDDQARDDVDAGILQAELTQAVQDGLTDLPQTQRTLLSLMYDGETRSYRDIGEILAIPVGGIGPTRARGLARLRRSPAVSSYLAAS